MATLTFDDFSGGLTERTVPGNPSKYQTADNLLIDTDKSLYSRPGFEIFSSTAYQLGAVERVARLVNFNNDSELIAAQNKNAYYISGGAWTSLLGPTSNNPFNTNTATSLISEAQWNKHLYLASNSGDPVIKLYRDSGNTLRLRTAGLPTPTLPDVYTDAAAKLAAAIVLAEDIKAMLHAHVNDFGVSPAAHLSKDTTTDTALDALSSPTTLNELIAYAIVLRTNYNLHVADTFLNKTAQNYHNEVANPAGGSDYTSDGLLNLQTDSTLPTDGNINTIEEVVRLLNDLRNRYNWHVVAPITHNNATQTSVGWGANTVATGTIDLDATTPTIANVAPLIRYVNYLKAEYNSHAQDLFSGNKFGHLNADSTNLVRMADCTDLHTAVGLLGCIAFHYSMHIETANRRRNDGVNAGFYGPADQFSLIFNGDVTATSAVITNVTPDPTVALGSPAVALAAGDHILRTTLDTSSPYTGWGSPPATGPGALPYFTNDYVVFSFTGTTITLSGGAAGGLVTTADVTFAFHWSGVHFDIERNTTAAIVNIAMRFLFQEDIDFSLADVESVTGFAMDLAQMLKAHETSALTVLTTADIISGAYYTKAGYTYYYNADTDFSQEYIPPHSYDPTSVTPNSLPFFPSSSTVRAEPVLEGHGYFEGPAGTFTDALTVSNYLYKLVRSYDYTVGSNSFTDLSAPSDSISVTVVTSLYDAASGDTGVARDATSFTSLPVLTNTSSQNYDTSVIALEIYRTIDDGTSFYKVGEVTNGTTTFSDTVLDSALVENEALYTNGGVVGNDSPPLAKYIHVHGSRMYYAIGNKVYQSLAQDPDSVPANFFDEFEEDVTGISSTRSSVVVLTAQSVYRMEGEFNDLGQGFLRHEPILNKTGCDSPQSIVKTDNGVFFAGKDGFYYTDGTQCIRVTDMIDTFLAFTSTSNKRNRIQGVYDDYRKKIYWTVQSDGALSDPNIMWVLDLQFGVIKDGTPVTTFSGGFDSYTGFRPTALAVYSKTLHYGDNSGYVMKQTDTLNYDVKRDTGVAATSWAVRTILWDYKGTDYNYGDARTRKYGTDIFFRFEQETNLSVQAYADNDKGRIVSALPQIRSRKLTDWSDSKIDWISSIYTAVAGEVIDEARKVPSSGGLRFLHRAVELKNAYCVIVSSDDPKSLMGNVNIASVSANVWSVTLIEAATRKWPLYSVDYYIRINDVDYPVTVRTSDSVIRVSDSGLTALTAQSNIEFEMWGYPKNEKMRIVDYSVDFETAGSNQKDYKGGSTDGGENG